MTELLPPNQPIKFEARNPRPAYRRTKTGDIYTLNIEITEEVWTSLKTLPDNAILECLMWFHDGDDVQPEPKPAKAKKEPKPKGEYAAFWSSMFRRSFHFSRELWEVLGVESGERVKDLLHEAFGVESLSFVPPQQFEGWCEANHLHTLVTMARQEAAKYEVSEMVS